MSDGLVTLLGIIGLIVLLEALDLMGLLRRKMRDGNSRSPQDATVPGLSRRNFATGRSSPSESGPHAGLED